MAGHQVLTIVLIIAMNVIASLASDDREMSHHEYGRCTLKYGVPSFKLSFICNKAFYVSYLSENSTNVACGLRYINCSREDVITSMSILVDDNGKDRGPQYAVLSDFGSGVVRREVQLGGQLDEKLELKDIVLSYCEDLDGNIKVTYLVCSDYTSREGVYKTVIMSSVPDMCFRDELNLLKRHFPVGGLCYIPNLCNINNYFK